MRKSNGQFDTGNKYAVGRPKRAVELDYLRALSEVVTLETWHDICMRARDDALNGDARARAWLAQYLIGTSALSELVRLEVLDILPGDYVRATVDAELYPGGDAELLKRIAGGESVLERAARLARGGDDEV